MDYVQLYISWLNKMDMLNSLISFSHEMTSVNRKNLIVGYLFSITHFFDKFKENFWIFLFIWANMDYVQLHISWLNKKVVLKSPGGVDVVLVAVLDASGYSKEVR